MFGISRRQYLRLDIKKLIVDQAKEIYRRNYSLLACGLKTVVSAAVSRGLLSPFSGISCTVHRVARVSLRAAA